MSQKPQPLWKDPVCGMDVNPATSKHKLDHAGKSYFFCCAGCAQKFKLNPDKYLNRLPCRIFRFSQVRRAVAAPAVSPLARARKTGCVCLPDVSSSSCSKPGPCPTCGMALEPGDFLKAQPARIHVPHASGNRPPRPDHAPSWGMALERGTVTASRRRKSQPREYDSPFVGQLSSYCAAARNREWLTWWRRRAPLHAAGGGCQETNYPD